MTRAPKERAARSTARRARSRRVIDLPARRESTAAWRWSRTRTRCSAATSTTRWRRRSRRLSSSSATSRCGPNFRGVGASAGEHDQGRGETEDLRARSSITLARAFTPIAGARGFLLRRLRADPGRAPRDAASAWRWWASPRVSSAAGAATPRRPCPRTASSSTASWTKPCRSPTCSPGRGRRSCRSIVVPGADHFFHRRLHIIKNIVKGYGVEQARIHDETRGACAFAHGPPVTGPTMAIRSGMPQRPARGPGDRHALPALAHAVGDHRRARSTSSSRTCSSPPRSRSAARSTSCCRSRPTERARGVIAVSAGNHAQGVAYHAQRLGIPRRHRDAARHAGSEGRAHARASAPKSCWPARLSTTRKAHGARARARARAHAGASLRRRAVIAGQGTIALEMLARAAATRRAGRARSAAAG